MEITFATSSEAWGSAASGQIGKYPAKLYNSSSVLICQVDNGADNGGRLPSGGILLSSAVASSMSEVVANPITFYGSNSAVIDQTRQSGDLYNYYWTSYTRGTDGQWDDYNWHNLYLDSYIPLRYKSIYDPCPYGYRIPSNGTYNQFTSNPGWTNGSYAGGNTVTLESRRSWIATNGRTSDSYSFIGIRLTLFTSSIASNTCPYGFAFYSNGEIRINRGDHTTNYGWVVRCIEECELLSDEIQN